MNASTEPALAVEGLGVSYGALVALDDVSWQVRPGEILGIIGPNGAGKSTCFDAVTHLTARRGSVRLAGEDITALPAHRLAAKGLRRAFQQNAFFANLTVTDNMLAVMQSRWGTGLAACVFNPGAERARSARGREAAERQLLKMGIPAQCHGARPGEIPYGTQRMLSIALAYGTGARVLMLDEPAAGLGGGDMERLVDLLGTLRRDGTALVVIEHHMDLIMQVTDEIVVLDQGTVLAKGTPAQIQTDAAVLEAYLGRTQ